MKEKFCKGCNEVLPIDRFSTSKNVSDGYENKCRACRTASRKKKHVYRCEFCKEEFSATKKQRFCSNVCSGLSKANSKSVFLEELKTKPNLEYVGGYINYYKPVDLRCRDCNHYFSPTPNNLFSKDTSCPKCYGNIRLTTEIFKEKVRADEGDSYEVYGEYHGNKEPIMMFHRVCNSVYLVTPTHWGSGRRCPVCLMSDGEKTIKHQLDKLNVKYHPQYRFEDCRNVYPLPFDFAIMKDEELVLLIEYDGEQHFHSIKHWGGDEALEKVRVNDAIKNEYCKENQLELVRIPYTEFKNIGEIITELILKIDNTEPSRLETDGRCRD